MPQPETRPYDVVKRGIDIALSSVGLVLTAPIQIVTATLVLANHGRPILFRQVRPGKDGMPFELLKFRTMRHPDGTLVTDEHRLTRFGRALRSTSLDELPSLWNVLKGDMSLVGPRPLLMKYLPLYSAGQARRHEVKPGLTGLAQVRGRNAISWEQKLALDVQYVDTRSLSVDIGILYDTVAVVLSRAGVSAEGESTTSEFRGSRTPHEGTRP